MDENKKIFYVCSYGGSGSKMLCSALNKYGETRHIHSRIPPDNLEYIGNENGGKTYVEWFNGIPVPDTKTKDYYVIYIYRNPSFSIPSRFRNPDHLKHIQTDSSIKLQDVLSSKQDLYNIREFYDNYTTPNKKRNYKIYCIKYEDIFDKQDELSSLLGIGELNLVNKSNRTKSIKQLDDIYSDLIDEMHTNKFIMVK